MRSFFVDRVRGWRVAALAAATAGYGFVLFAVPPFWRRMEAAEGGAELQTRFGYNAEQARSALSALKADAPGDALAFYALDTIHALLYGAAFAALIAFGLRRLRWEQTPLSWLIVAPFVSAAADIAENACMAYAVLNNPAQPELLHAAAAFTQTKFIIAIGAQALGFLAALTGLAVWCVGLVAARRG